MSGQRGYGCGDPGAVTPATVFNPPGLDAIGYRVGRYGEFLAGMLDRLSGPAYPGLRDLTVRTPDDPAIALIDSWAVLADLLTFYSERIANEGYLRTATEDGSLALLGRLVGHRPRPGVAADTYLAYTLDRDPRAADDRTTVIPRGARSQSVPGPGEAPQSFETAEDLAARWAWNELAVRRRRPYQVSVQHLQNGDRAQLSAAGTANNLKPGDQLLFVFDADSNTDQGRRLLKRVQDVRIDRDADVTVIGLPPRTLPTLKDLRDEVGAWITASEGAPNPRPGNSRIIRDLDDQWLRQLRADLPGIDNPSDLADRLDPVIARVREATALAAPYPAVAQWLDRLAGELAGLREQARGLEPPQPRESPLGRAPAAGESPTADPAVRGLGSLLASLRTAPTRPPLSARDLDRDPRRIFGAGSDLGPQLLAALDPRLRDGLYAAWRQVDLTAPLALRDVQAMRVVATPFGATAPLKPVFGPGGGVLRYEDYPLTGNRLLSMTISFDDTGTPTRADFSYVESGAPLPPLSLGLPTSGSLQGSLGAGTVQLTVTAPPTPPPAEAAATEAGVGATFSSDLPGRPVVVSRPDSHDVVHITLDGATTPLEEGDKRTVQSGELSVTLEYQRATTGAPRAVAVTFTSRMQQVPSTTLALDGVYEQIVPGGWVVIQRPNKKNALKQVITRVTSVHVISRADFGIAAKVTELSLQIPWLDQDDTQLSDIRATTVYARGEPLRLADEAVTDDVLGRDIELAELYDGLTPGRWVVISGERGDIPGTTGVRGTELAMIAGVRQSVDPLLPGDTVHTTITLSADLAYSYRRDTVRIAGNVVRATQGATRDEAIGSGDAGTPGQTFTLWQSPLTWLAADTPEGARSTLEVRVDGVRWHEVDSLAGRGPGERVYVTGAAADGRTTVTFGDGVHGSRLPTGQENVRARYRVGIGAVGNVGAGRISQLTSRPLGVSAVVNPLPATGGADPDGPGPARRNIPLAVTALDRLVSVPDYEDFTRGRAGIGRASATELSDGEREIIHVTVAGVDDIPIAADSDLIRTLRKALTTYGDPGLPVRVAVREPVLLVIAASVKVAPDHSWELVEPTLRDALLARLGYPGRQLGQPAHLSELLATAQAVPGVDYLEVDTFTGVPSSLTPAGLEHLVDGLARPQSVVRAELARFQEQRYRVREDETLTEIAALNGISIADLLRLNPDITDTGPLRPGRVITVFRGILPAQLAMLSPDLPDTLILKEVRG
ncbi:putative baseplate assembly protein [Kitasatospora sp. NPDC056783]|uniref:putative baseplate assembly protein n=1 Tax=Kitasatospora sp. NPDC056783 TaxID=3345943 RepID=UPI0036B16C6A